MIFFFIPLRLVFDTTTGLLVMSGGDTLSAHLLYFLSTLIYLLIYIVRVFILIDRVVD